LSVVGPICVGVNNFLVPLVLIIDSCAYYVV
jgi:hypothetical protein